LLVCTAEFLFLHIACIHPSLNLTSPNHHPHHQLTADVTVHSHPSLLAQPLPRQDITQTHCRICLSRSSLTRGSYPSKTHWALELSHRIIALDPTTLLDSVLPERLEAIIIQ